MARAVQLLFVPTPSHPRTACDGGTLRPNDLHDGDTHRTGIRLGRTAPPADLRNKLTRPYGSQGAFAADQQTRQIHCIGVRQSPARRIALQPAYLRKQRGIYCKGHRHAQTCPRSRQNSVLHERRESAGKPTQVRQRLSYRPTLRPCEEDKLLHLDGVRGVRHIRRKRRNVHCQRRTKSAHAAGHFHALYADMRPHPKFPLQGANRTRLLHDQIQQSRNPRRIHKSNPPNPCRRRKIRKRHQRGRRTEPRKTIEENPLHQ